jgi:hypothetical protein
MPGYRGAGQATLLRENMQAYLWQNEPVAVGELSVAFELARINRSYYPWGLSFELVFSAAPGSFEVDLVGANNDVAGNYIQLATTDTVNGAFVARWDMPSNLWMKYVAAFMKTPPSAGVLTTLLATR